MGGFDPHSHPGGGVRCPLSLPVVSIRTPAQTASPTFGTFPPTRPAPPSGLSGKGGGPTHPAGAQLVQQGPHQPPGQPRRQGQQRHRGPAPPGPALPRRGRAWGRKPGGGGRPRWGAFLSGPAFDLRRDPTSFGVSVATLQPAGGRCTKHATHKKLNLNAISLQELARSQKTFTSPGEFLSLCNYALICNLCIQTGKIHFVGQNIKKKLTKRCTLKKMGQN